MIGIIGGVGPLAGLDIYRKIIEETQAVRDQEHISVLLYSLPDRIGDRTAFLLDRTRENPGGAMAKIARQLEKAGATVAAIPCNTAHAEPIFSVVEQEMKGSSLKLLHIVDETIGYIQVAHPNKRVTVLSTTGTRQEGIYSRRFAQKGVEVLEPKEQEKVHDAIYNPEYGIKAQSIPVTATAISALESVLDELQERGAEVVVLGCTELPLALPQETYKGMHLIDPNRILARALIREIAPEKLATLP